VCSFARQIPFPLYPCITLELYMSASTWETGYEIAACAALNRRAGKPVMKSQCHTDMPAAMCNIYAAKVSFKLVLAEFHTHF